MKKVTTAKKIVAQDEMSSKVSLVISLPTDGMEGMRDALNEMDALSKKRPSSISTAKEIIAECEPLEGGELSKADFFDRCQTLFDRAGKVLSTIPQELRADVSDALDMAFKGGGLFYEAILRDENLIDVTRERKQQKARSDGGTAKGPRQRTPDLLDEIDKLLKSDPGMSQRKAADLALRNLGISIGEISPEAARNRYRYWKARNREKFGRLLS